MDREHIQRCLGVVAAYRASGHKGKAWTQANSGRDGFAQPCAGCQPRLRHLPDALPWRPDAVTVSLQPRRPLGCSRRSGLASPKSKRSNPSSAPPRRAQRSRWLTSPNPHASWCQPVVRLSQVVRSPPEAHTHCPPALASHWPRCRSCGQSWRTRCPEACPHRP
jgi:hypothetical protein